MKINGYQLREGIKRWILQRDATTEQFKGSLFAFKGEKTQGPDKVMAEFEQADKNVARLEELQQLYNQTVICPVLNEKLSLALCVKLVGGAGRREKMWREAAVGKRDRYSYREDAVRERDKDKEYAERALSVEDCITRAKVAAKYASALRNALARGNSTDVDSEKLGITAEELTTLFE